MEQNFSNVQKRAGWIEVIVGCMFSGKTEELIRQIRRAQIARQKVQVFKPRLDSRYSQTHVASHNKSFLSSMVIDQAAQILSLVTVETMVVGIDEGQFFGPELVTIATTLAGAGKRVVIAGLDTDWRGQPFGPIPQLLAVAEVIRKQYAICVVCGDSATRTQRLIAATSDILVGANDAYEARCRIHFAPDLAVRPMPSHAMMDA